MILVGSSAIKHWFPDFKREPKDLDYVVQTKQKSGRGIEYHLNPIFDNYPHPIMLPNDLYTLKISHLFWDIKWEKHLYDVQFLKAKNCSLDSALFNSLYEYWKKFHGANTRSNLKMSAKEFFNNALKKYDHDYLHTLIKPNPVYKKILKDGSEVEPSEMKFNNLSHEEKLELVREEIYVMAYERLGERSYSSAYAWMLKKFIISHAPIWEAIFIIENHKELYKPIINYKQKLDYELSRNYCRT